MITPDLTGVTWRKSTFTGDNGQCVEVAEIASDTIAIRNSNHPRRGALLIASTEVAAFVEACKSGNLDDLTS